MKSTKRYYGTVEAASTLQVSLATIFRMMKDGRLKGCKLVGNRVRIPAKQVEQYLVPIDTEKETA